MPITTTVPIALRARAPEPEESIRGMHPRTNAREVIRMGRRRKRAAASVASIRPLPRCISRLANSTMRMAFLAASPTSITRPICA